MKRNKRSLSVIISVMNALPVTKICFDCLRENIAADKTEIIVINNASTDGTAEWLEQQEDIKVITNAEPHSLAASFNQGLEESSGEEILFMHNDTYLLTETVARLEKVLFQSEKIGAAMPVCNYPILPINRMFYPIDEYGSLQEAKENADRYYQKWGDMVAGQILAEDYCLLVKRAAIEQTGLFDEQFAVRYGEDWDYSIRLIKAGWEIVRAEGVFVHHQGGETFATNSLNANKAVDMFVSLINKKWGFDIFYSGGVRRELFREVDFSRPKLAVLDIGCAMGGDLAYVKSRRRDARACGIELNQLSAEIASHFGEVKAADVEKLEIPEWERSFDYIIMGDILEHLHEPQEVIVKAKKLLKPEGILIVSLPNVMNIGVVTDLLNGRWHYEDSGILDRTHLRFFTLKEMEEMFVEAGYSFEQFGGSLSIPADCVNVLEELKQLKTVNVDTEQMKYLQFYIKAKLVVTA